jgi:tetratricopeptide (TPR) repeat protein
MNDMSQLIQRALKEYKLKNYKSAIEYGERIVRRKQGTAVVHSILGDSYRRSGQFTKAIDEFTKAVRIEKSARNYYNLAVSLQSADKWALAIEKFEAALALEPNNNELHRNKGIAEAHLGYKYQALNSFKRAIEINAEDDSAYLQIGIILYQNGRISDSIAYFKKSSELNPGSVQAANFAGLALFKNENYFGAIKEFERSLGINKTCDTHNNLGLSYQKLGNKEKAAHHFYSAEQNFDLQQNVLLNLASFHASYGEFDKAARHYRKIIDNCSDSSEAIRRYAQLNLYSKKEPIRWIEKYHRSEPQSVERRNLCFALVDYYERQENFEESFQFLQEGNRIEKTRRGYTIKEDQQFLSRLILHSSKFEDEKAFSSEAVEKYTPIFIVGMPRSGTTLIENILSRHENVETSGETNYVKYFGANLALGEIEPTKEKISTFRTDYISSISKNKAKCEFVIDKMPLNFRFLPLISIAFPEGIIININRDARATCWSNYRNFFPSAGMGYTNNLSDVIQFYKAYRTTMSHWEKQLGNRILKIDYDHLVANPEDAVRELATQLNIKFDNDMLFPHRNKGAINTSSYQQVRNPIYKDSSKQWRNYQNSIGNEFVELDK